MGLGSALWTASLRFGEFRATPTLSTLAYDVGRSSAGVVAIGSLETLAAGASTNAETARRALARLRGLAGRLRVGVIVAYDCPRDSSRRDDHADALRNGASMLFTLERETATRATLRHVVALNGRGRLPPSRLDFAPTLPLPLPA